MKLFHGSNTDIDTIDLSQGHRYKDFGQGFYLTPNYDTASRMAKKRALLFGGTSCVIEYDLDESYKKDTNLKVKLFPEKACVEWARFVDDNRNRGKSPAKHDYDIVVGPIADDGVAYLLGRFHEGTKSIEELAEDLQDRFLDQQYYLGTERAVKYLSKIKTTIL